MHMKKNYMKKLYEEDRGDREERGSPEPDRTGRRGGVEAGAAVGAGAGDDDNGGGGPGRRGAAVRARGRGRGTGRRPAWARARGRGTGRRGWRPAAATATRSARAIWAAWRRGQLAREAREM